MDSSPEEESCSSASLVVAVTPDGSISTLRKVFNPIFLPSCLMICQNLQVGGGSFHPSTLISATQMAVSVAEEVYFEISILGPKKLSDFQVDRKLMSKLKDEEALGDTRERIGFL